MVRSKIIIFSFLVLCFLKIYFRFLKIKNEPYEDNFRPYYAFRGLFLAQKSCKNKFYYYCSQK